MLAFVPQSLQIIRMKDPTNKVRRQNIFQGKTRVFEIAPIGVKESPVWFQDKNVLRNNVYELPKLHFVLFDSLFRHLRRSDIHHRPNELDFT